MKAFYLVFTFILAACSQDSGSSNKANNPPAGGGGGQQASGCTAQSVLPDNTTGGCRIRLVSPASCEVMDLSGGKTYEVAWTTDGTTCETPWKLLVAGNPVTDNNVFEFSVSTDGGNVTQKGGVIQINAAAFDGIPTSDGYYHWVVQSFHGSHPASFKFKVNK